MGRVNSNRKGKRGERAFAKVMEELGYEARRSQQYQGVSSDPDSADLQHSIANVRAEIKFGYDDEELWRQTVKKWIKDAKLETPEGSLWFIAWKRTRKQWEIIFEIEGIIVKTDDVEGALHYLEAQMEGSLTAQLHS